MRLNGSRLTSSTPIKCLIQAPALLILVLVSISIQSTTSSPLSVVAISHISSNQTVVCALLPSPGDKRPVLNCTNLRDRKARSYPSSRASYLAIAAGDGFLCALTASFSSNAAMRCWNFTQADAKSKRIYRGPLLEALAAGGYHMCGLIGMTHEPKCWRWHALALPAALSFSVIAVGQDFLCGIAEHKAIKCYGRDASIVGKEPAGSFDMLASGGRHACAVSSNGTLVCWGDTAPAVDATIAEVASLALGDNKTCVLSKNGTVRCLGDNSALPKYLVQSRFLAIEAKGGTICGVLELNYSLVCWGSKEVGQNPIVFERVLPGACVASCPCDILPGSGNICFAGVICQPCMPSATSPPSAPPSNNERSNGIRWIKRALIITGCTGLGISLITAMCLLLFKLRKGSRTIHDTGQLNRVEAMPTSQLREHQKGHLEQFSLQTLLAITDNFSDVHKIGSGSFGTVYHATLHDGREVAIKRAWLVANHKPLRKGHQDKDSAFQAELAVLSRINHKNVIRLLGFCCDGIECALVYEFMAGGTLHDHLHKLPRSPLASWTARLKVALDVARGIEYLHMYVVPPVIHRDIKPSNILLDADWTAKISDFGLSLASLNEDMAQLCAAGTIGYMDPEYYQFHFLTDKSDVYSFGVVLLELLTGRKAVHQNNNTGSLRNVVDLTVTCIEAGDIHHVLDPRLPLLASGEPKAVMDVGQLAVQCVKMDSAQRPPISEVIGSLERAVAMCHEPLRHLTHDCSASNAGSDQFEFTCAR